MAEKVRTHVLLPREMVEEIDRLVGKRCRSKFVEETLEAKLQRARLGDALRLARGSIDLSEHPEWSTPEKVSAWVRAQRQMDNDRLERLNQRRRELEGA